MGSRFTTAHTNSSWQVSIHWTRVTTMNEVGHAAPDLASSATTGEGTSTAIATPFFERSDWFALFLTAVTLLAVYLWTMVPEVTLDNGGIQVSGAAYAGVPDVPGYPVWTIYAWLCTKLIPFGNLAWRVAVGSAVAAAAACGIVALMVSRGGRLIVEGLPAYAGWDLAEHRTLRLICGLVSGLALGLTQVIWSNAVIADVWTLKVLLFAVMICLLMRWTATPMRRRYLYAAFLVYGLLIATAEELIAVAPGLIFYVMLVDPKVGRDVAVALTGVVAFGWCPINVVTPFPWLQPYTYGNGPLLISFEIVGVAFIAAVVFTRRFGTEWKAALFCAALFLVGGTAYYYEPIAGMTTPPVNWGYPRTTEGFMHLVERGQFARLNPTHDFGIFVRNLWMMGADVVGRFGWYYVGFIVLTVVVLPWTNRVTRRWLLGLAALFCCVGPLTVAVFNPAWDRQSRDLIAPWFSCVYVMLAIGTGLGLAAFGTMAARRRPEI